MVGWLSIEEGEDYVDIDEKRLPYRYEGSLGRGQSSIVDEVIDIRTERSFARKTFIVKRDNRRYIKELFRNELTTIRRVAQHHHMIRIFATYTTKDRLGIILYPVADGGDLDDFLGDLYQDDLNMNDATVNTKVAVLKRAFGCLAAGLAFLREQRIRHKDIKPENILIDRGRVLYTDFGLALDSTMFESSTTEGPTSMTRKWAAPELLSGRPRNSSSDVYSLGCVFVKIFAVINKSIEYNGMERYSTSMEHIHRQLLAGPRCRTGMEFLPHVIVWMTQRDPTNRYTAQAVWEECSKHTSFRCEQCYQLSSPVALRQPVSSHHIPPNIGTLSHPNNVSSQGAGTPYWTDWEPSPSHDNRNYCYLMSADGRTILDTRWDPPYSNVPRRSTA